MRSRLQSFAAWVFVLAVPAAPRLAADTTRGDLKGFACRVVVSGRCESKQGVLVSGKVEAKGFADSARSSDDGIFVLKQVPVGERVALTAWTQEVEAGRTVIYFGEGSGTVQGEDSAWWIDDPRDKKMKMRGTMLPTTGRAPQGVLRLALARVAWPAWAGVQQFNGGLSDEPVSSAQPPRSEEVFRTVITAGGAPLSSATLTIVDAATGKPAGGVSGARGSFQAELKPLNNYILMVSAAGYNSASFVLLGGARGFHIASTGGNWMAADRVELVPRPTEPPENPYVQDNIENAQGMRRYFFKDTLIQALPLGGVRTVDTLALLCPGVLPAPEAYARSGPGLSSGIGTAGQFSVNGLRSRENNFTVDGSDNNDEDVGVRRQGFLTPFPQSIESLTTFQIVTGLAEARYGRAIGGQVNAVSKIGGGRFHGNVYGFLSDSRFNARDYFNPARGGNSGLQHGLVPITATGELSAPPVWFDLGPAASPLVQVIDGKGFQPGPSGRKNPYTRTQTGVGIGGPLIRAKTFFFASFERQAVHASRESHFSAPSVRQRGIFASGDTGLYVTERLGSPGGGSPVFPATLPGNAVFSLFPFPNDPAGPFGSNSYSAVLPADASGRLYSVKVDQYLNKWMPQLLTARYNLTDDDTTVPAAGGALFSTIRPTFRTQNVVLVLSSHIRTGLANNFRASYGRTSGRFRQVPNQSLTPSVLFPDEPFLLNAPMLINTTLPESDARYVSSLSAPGQQLLAGIRVNDTVGVTERYLGPLGQVSIAGFSPLGVDTFHFPQRRNQHTFQIADTLTWVSGKHVVHAGFDIRRLRFNSVVARNNRPALEFHGLRGRVFRSLLAGFESVDGPLYPADDVVGWPVFSALDLASGGAPSGQFQTIGITEDFALGLRKSQVDLFIQDEIRITPRLRLNLGLRLEFNRLPKDLDDQLVKAFDPERFEAEVQKAETACPELDLFRQRCLQTIASAVTLLSSDLGRTFGGDRVGNDPRVAFAWDPSGAGRTVIRGGWGVYTGQFPAIVLNESRSTFPSFSPLNYATSNTTVGIGAPFLYNFARGNSDIRREGSLSTIQPDNPEVPNLLSLITQKLIFYNPSLNLVQPAVGFKNPYALHYTLAIDRQFKNDYWVTLSYVGTSARKLLRVWNPSWGQSRNGVRFEGILPRGQFPLFWADLTQYKTLSSITSNVFVNRLLFEGTANSSYNSLQAELKRRYRGGLQFGWAFTYSHSIDDASDFFDTSGAFALPQNSPRRSERGSSSFDSRMRSATLFVWDLPWFKHHKLLGGWQLSGIHTAQSGQPFTVNTAIDWNTDGNLTDRLNNTVGLRTGPVDGDRRIRLAVAPGFDPALLLPVNTRSEELANYGDGAVGRNTFRSSGVNNLDLAVVKGFALREDWTLRFRCEFFNILNRSHFGIPVRILEAPGFGESVTTTVPARTLQFALKLSF